MLNSYHQEDIIGFDCKDQSLTRFVVRIFVNCEKNTRHMNIHMEKVNNMLVSRSSGWPQGVH